MLTTFIVFDIIGVQSKKIVKDCLCFAKTI